MKIERGGVGDTSRQADASITREMAGAAEKYATDGLRAKCRLTHRVEI
jgi:hypothetical protein